MKKVVFIVGSQHYAKDLLSRHLNKYTDATCYDFFSISEMMLYWRLGPDVIICDSNEFGPSKNNVRILNNRFNNPPLVFTVRNQVIFLNQIRSNRLKVLQKLPYTNFYNSLTSMLEGMSEKRHKVT